MSTVDNIEKLVAAAGDLAETKIELIKLKTAGKVSSSLSSIVSIIVLLFFCMIAVTILSFGLAYMIGSSLQNISYGFFIVGGIYTLIGLLVYANRKSWVQDPLSNIFIDKIIK